MAIDHTAIVSAVQNVTNGTKFDYAIHWIQTELSFLTLHEWIAVIVGIAAVAAYASATIHNIHKTRDLKNERKK